ncbi:hypothetical protein F1640_14910 [Novosphingobium sp. NBM11]|uniref:phage baseplate protein n=1 Tax=Novosphingobium sp. NBM11 TaxID=2596914 RepID=UPI0018928663|nr:hypothetical protein [Novosphingobium sp. NBM11]MBF5091277.1 hypothetical protein [Novosphingobium sp. NBM11]
MAGPEFPNVPATPGVPTVQRGDENPPTEGEESQLSSDSITVTATAKNQWGIYTLGGALVVHADSVVAIGYDAEHRIATYPLQEGAFETYDKVALPFDVRVVMSKGGNLTQRAAFIREIEEIRGDIEIYNVVTPERAYLNVNVSRVTIDRSREQGAGLITAEVHLVEIRQNATATFTTTKSPASADPVSNGHVQPSTSTVDTSGVK